MPRNKIVNGVEVQLTPGEEKARDIEEAQAKLDHDEYLKVKYKDDRKMAYPNIIDVVVALAEKEEGDDTMWKEITALRKKVKSDNPKST